MKNIANLKIQLGTVLSSGCIEDIDFRNLVNQLPEGASFTMLSDSCHSGGLIDKEKEQIGPSFIDSGSTPHHHPRQKSIPFDSILHHLASITGIDSLEISVHLLELFGNQASLKFQSLDLPSERSGLFKPVRLDNGILLSGCQANETSADANPTGDLTKAYGAFSNAVQLVMKEHCEVLSNKEVVTHARELLHAQGFKQHPCLYCSDGNENAPFLWKLESSST